jgi:hypothetical protein
MEGNRESGRISQQKPEHAVTINYKVRSSRR